MENIFINSSSDDESLSHGREGREIIRIQLILSYKVYQGNAMNGNKFTH